MSEANERDDIYTLTDEDGNESEFELLGEMSMDDNTYLALIPLENDDEECVILKVTTDENGEELLVTVDDDDEFERISEIFYNTYMDEWTSAKKKTKRKPGNNAKISCRDRV